MMNRTFFLASFFRNVPDLYGWQKRREKSRMRVYVDHQNLRISVSFSEYLARGYKIIPFGENRGN
jgi:hypothetical protein